MKPTDAEIERIARTCVGIATVLMAHRGEREKTGCWTGGYVSEICDGDLRCRCADEAEAEAQALYAAGYSRRADVITECAKVADDTAVDATKAAAWRREITELHMMHTGREVAAKQIASAIRALATDKPGGAGCSRSVFSFRGRAASACRKSAWR